MIENDDVEITILERDVLALGRDCRSLCIIYIPPMVTKKALARPIEVVALRHVLLQQHHRNQHQHYQHEHQYHQRQ